MGQDSGKPVVGARVPNHPRFDKARVLKDPKGKIYLETTKAVMEEEYLTTWAKQYPPLRNQEPLFLPRSHEFKKNTACGNSGICRMSFDNYPHLLSTEISDRARDKNYFNNEELWYLTFTLLEAASIMHSRGRKVGDIQPMNVFINQEGQTKVASSLSWPHETDNYQKTLFDKEVTYLAPEELQDLRDGKVAPHSQGHISQAFSIGLTLLDAACLSSSANLYNLSGQRMDFDQLQNSKRQVRSRNDLDQALKQIIVGLAHPQSVQRLKCKEVFKWMEQYRQKIKNLTAFSIMDPPEWLRLHSFRSTTVQPAPGLSQTRFTYSSPTSNFQPVPSSSVYASRQVSVGQPVAYTSSNFKRVDEQIDISRRMFPH